VSAHLFRGSDTVAPGEKGEGEAGTWRGKPAIGRGTVRQGGLEGRASMVAAAGWLERLLCERPEIVPSSAVRQGAGELRLAFGSVGPEGEGLIGLSAGGDVAVIRCRAAGAASEGSGAVLGAILEQAAAVGGRSYAELDAIARDRLGRELADAMEERVASSVAAGAWDRREFEERVGQAVESGDVGLVIALDRPDEALLRTIRFIWEAWAVVLPLHVIVVSSAGGDWQADVVY
jgi:hypothetical protein